MIGYHPISVKKDQFGRKVLPGICNRICIWICIRICIREGDALVADIEELQNMDASEIHARRLDAKEVLMLRSGDTCTFTVADGTIELTE